VVESLWLDLLRLLLVAGTVLVVAIVDILYLLIVLQDYEDMPKLVYNASCHLRPKVTTVVFSWPPTVKFGPDPSIPSLQSWIVDVVDHLLLAYQKRQGAYRYSISNSNALEGVVEAKS